MRRLARVPMQLNAAPWAGVIWDPTLHRMITTKEVQRLALALLIYGAGDAAEMIVREMKSGGAFYRYEPIGFVDDNPAKIGQHIHGVPVLGSGDEVAKIVQKHKPDEILLAIPSASGSQIRKIVRHLEAFKVPIKTLPPLSKLEDNKVGVSQIQNLSIEDLLDRSPVALDLVPVRELMRGKRVLTQLN